MTVQDSNSRHESDFRELQQHHYQAIRLPQNQTRLTSSGVAAPVNQFCGRLLPLYSVLYAPAPSQPNHGNILSRCTNRGSLNEIRALLQYVQVYRLAHSRGGEMPSTPYQRVPRDHVKKGKPSLRAYLPAPSVFLWRNQTAELDVQFWPSCVPQELSKWPRPYQFPTSVLP